MQVALLSSRPTAACRDHRRRDVHCVKVIDPGGKLAGEGSLAGADVQHVARSIGDELLQDVEHVRRIRRPVLVRVRNTRLGEDSGEPAG